MHQKTTSNHNKVAFITGASRGIGKQATLALAKQGFDVVITARTLHDGEQHERGAFQSDTSAVTGSLNATAAEVQALGRKALPIRMDLLDTDSITAAYEQAIDHFGHIDLLLNNGIYQGPGLMAPVATLTADIMQTIYQGNIYSQMQLIQHCLPHMLERHSGCIINMVSASGMMDPPATPKKVAGALPILPPKLLLCAWWVVYMSSIKIRAYISSMSSRVLSSPRTCWKKGWLMTAPRCLAAPHPRYPRQSLPGLPPLLTLSNFRGRRSARKNTV